MAIGYSPVMKLGSGPYLALLTAAELFDLLSDRLPDWV